MSKQSVGRHKKCQCGHCPLVMGNNRLTNTRSERPRHWARPRKTAPHPREAHTRRQAHSCMCMLGRQQRGGENHLKPRSHLSARVQHPENLGHPCMSIYMYTHTSTQKNTCTHTQTHRHTLVETQTCTQYRHTNTQI